MEEEDLISVDGVYTVRKLGNGEKFVVLTKDAEGDYRRTTIGNGKRYIFDRV